VTNELNFDSIELMDAVQASFDCSDLENPMGERSKDALRLDFDRKQKVEFHGTKVTIDAGLLAYRELDEVLGLTMMIESELTDSRTGKNTQRGLLALLRQSVYSRLTGFDDTNDAERMSVDPAMRNAHCNVFLQRCADGIAHLPL